MNGSKNGNIIQRIADGRTDLVFEWVSVGYPAASTDRNGVALMFRPAYDLVLKVLLAYGANPNCVMKPDAETDGFVRDCRRKGETPLHRAAALGAEQAIQLLLDAGAIVDAKDMNGDGRFSIHPPRQSTYDHGMGSGLMGVGKPHTPQNGSA
jgi:hypothetical protein